MIELIAAFLCGSFVTVVLVVAGVLIWLYSQSQKITWEDKDEKPYIHPQLPQVNKLIGLIYCKFTPTTP